MFYWIYDISTVSLGILFGAASLAIAWIGAIFLRPVLRLFVKRGPEVNDVVGYILSCFCVFYGLLLGLLAVAVYQNYTSVEASVGAEAASLNALYRNVSSYPEPARKELQEPLKELTRYIIEEAWPEQQKGIVPTGGSPRVTAFQDKLMKFEPVTKGQEIIHAQTLGQFNDYITKRRIRLQSVTTAVPGILWYIVLLGAIMNGLLVLLFDMGLMAHLFLGGILAFFVGAVIFVIAAMDNPFRGEVSISPEPFVLIYENMKK